MLGIFFSMAFATRLRGLLLVHGGAQKAKTTDNECHISA